MVEASRRLIAAENQAWKELLEKRVAEAATRKLTVSP
jgi:hypothetical protein